MLTKVIWVLLGLGVLLGIYLLFREQRHKRRTNLRVEKLYASQLYRSLYPFLITYVNFPIDQLVVDKTGVCLRCRYQDRWQDVSYRLSEHGFRNLNKEQQEALCMLLEREMPVLGETDKYGMMVRHRTLLNGERDRVCIYAMRPAYKNKCSETEGYEKGLFS